jgi:aromatic-amino-acid transaminase
VSLLIPSHQGRPADDPIFSLNREANERSKAGEAIINATVGALLDDQGALAILPSAVRAVREVPPEEWAAYAPIAGTPAFLAAVKADVLGSAPDLAAAAVAVATPGGSGALRHAIANFLEPGQKLLTTSYFWSPYQTLADESDRGVATFPMFRGDGGFDVGALDRALGEHLASQGRALLFLNDPCHNPTGYSMTRAEWDAVVECIGRHAARGPVTVLVDGAYVAYAPRDLSDTLEALRPLSGRAGLLFAWSASKTFTHYGLRVGALVAVVPDAAERAQVESALSYSSRGTWSNCNRGGLAAVTRLLVDEALAPACRREREELKAMLRGRVEVFNTLARPAGLTYPRYEGGFFVTLFADEAPARAAAMRGEGVFVVPQKGALRVALCSVPERDIPRLVESLARHGR